MYQLRAKTKVTVELKLQAVETGPSMDKPPRRTSQKYNMCKFAQNGHRIQDG